MKAMPHRREATWEAFMNAIDRSERLERHDSHAAEDQRGGRAELRRRFQREQDAAPKALEHAEAAILAALAQGN